MVVSRNCKGLIPQNQQNLGKLLILVNKSLGFMEQNGAENTEVHENQIPSAKASFIIPVKH